MNAANDNSKNALFVAQQYVRLYACKGEVLGLSLNELVLHKTKEQRGPGQLTLFEPEGPIIFSLRMAKRLLVNFYMSQA
jgi:hypothetical protein